MFYCVFSREVEGMTDCMYGIFSSPKKPLDVLVSKLFAARNIKPLAKRVCGLVPGKGSHTRITNTRPCKLKLFSTKFYVFLF